MALDARDIPLTREAIYNWLQEYDGLESKPPIREFFAGKLNKHNLSGIEVNTSTSDSLDDYTPLLDMILADLPSYGFSDE